MSNRELPMMPWFPKEFAAATSTWSFAERSAYRALLDVQWEMGVLPTETWRLTQSIGMPPEDFEAVWPVVRRKFHSVEGGIRNERLEEHRVTAFRLKQGHKKGAESTNAKRGAYRPAERIANRTAERNAERIASDTPPSPSPSPSEESDPSQPFPATGKDGLPDGDGGSPRQSGTNPRALGANSRARGTNPRVERNRSLEAWRETTAAIDQVAATADSPAAQRLTWADLGTWVQDHAAIRAAENVGFRLIADRDKFTTTDLQARFREAYEQQLRRAPDPPPTESPANLRDTSPRFPLPAAKPPPATPTEAELTERARVLAEAGSDPGDIAHLLKQYGVTVDQVRGWLAAGGHP